MGVKKEGEVEEEKKKRRGKRRHRRVVPCCYAQLCVTCAARMRKRYARPAHAVMSQA